MSRNSSTTEFRCPKCGAASALLFPHIPHSEDDVTLKCLACSAVIRLPREKVFTGTALSRSTQPAQP